MARNKKKDLLTLNKFVETLEQFKKEKLEKWEKIDDAVQSKIRPATPSEDWTNFPDEQETAKLLMQDLQYRILRNEIEQLKKEVNAMALFLNEHAHPLQWLNFDNPLIGNAALEDAIAWGKSFSDTVQKRNYLFTALSHLIIP